MLSHQRIRPFINARSRLAMSGALSVLVLSVAGCSADLGRLIDSPSVGLSDKPIPSEPLRRNAGGPVDQGTWDASGARGGERLPPPAPRQALMAPDQGVRAANLPSASVPAQFTSQQRPAPMRSSPVSTVPNGTAHAATATDGTIDVQPGDTLYGLSKKHGVSIAALMDANQLTSPNLRPGQKLALPAKSAQAPRKPLTRPAVVAANPAAPAAGAAPASTIAAVASNWEGSYILKPGESLYGVARAHKVPLAELQRVNNVTEPQKLRAGHTLKVPSSGSAAITAAVPASRPAVPPSVPLAARPAAPATSLPPRVVATAPVTGGAPIASQSGAIAPKIINATPPTEPVLPEQKVAALGGTASDAMPAAATTAPAADALSAADAAPKPVRTAAATPAASGPKFRWPVKGKVIGEFGKRGDGTHNDGVNIAVPAGTDIHAVEGGTVAYAGSELKGYGNLVLIRHDNGWVSAYAHSEQVLVKRGDAIKRGQVIAKAGKTGTVDQPQVHFELRQGSKPVDPLPHMEKN